MNRRQALSLLGTVGVGVTAGCMRISEQAGDTNEENGEQESTPTSTPTPTGTPTQTPEPTAPEPRFVVDKSGNGDYGKLQEAYRVAKSGDVIGLESGSYSIKLNTGDLDIDKSLTLVGAGRDETTVAINGGSQEISMSDNAINFWHLTAEPARDNGYFYTDAYWITCYTRYNIPTRGWKGGARAGGSVGAYKTVFDADPINPETANGVRKELGTYPLRIGSVTATKSTFNIPPHLEGHKIEQSVLKSRPLIRDTGEIAKSRMDNGLALRADKGERFTVTDSEIHAGKDGFSFKIAGATSTYTTSDRFRYMGPSILNSKIYGKIDDKKTSDVWKSLLRLEGNIFEATEFEGDYFIDGLGARLIRLNAFIGADIRINSGKPKVYDKERELGNYYSAYDKKDENGDGIIDLPRPIPGEGGVTDQYPLANKDLSKYQG